MKSLNVRGQKSSPCTLFLLQYRVSSSGWGRAAQTEGACIFILLIELHHTSNDARISAFQQKLYQAPRYSRVILDSQIHNIGRKHVCAMWC
jgi:hypothetical protein